MPSNPTPETCRELADKLERYGESNVFRPGLFLTFMLGQAPTIITALRGYADAAGEIERLRAENARLSAAGERWIPVSERLPEILCDVIVHFQSLGSTTQAYRCQTGVWRDSGGAMLEGLLITHWQPLPEPPAGSKESEVTNG